MPCHVLSTPTHRLVVWFAAAWVGLGWIGLGEQIVRYSRQLLLPEVGVHAQERIAASRVLVVGGGGLGAPVCLYLAAAGVGSLGIIDGDSVEIDNLHRQIIHSELTLKVPKAVSARDACLRLNSSIKVQAYQQLFDEVSEVGSGEAGAERAVGRVLVLLRECVFAALNDDSCVQSNALELVKQYDIIVDASGAVCPPSLRCGYGYGFPPALT